MRRFLFIAWAAFFVMPAHGERVQNAAREPAEWTVMIYAAVDSTAESYIMPHLAQVKALSRHGLNGNVVLFIDRAQRDSRDRRTLGGNFEDARLFHLEAGRWRRVGGGDEFPEITLRSEYEANTGDARTLQKFTRFARSTYPARRYALMLFGHGEGHGVCHDTHLPGRKNGELIDPLYTAEITDTLTVVDSVEILFVDVCSFGGIENAYQFRPAVDRFHARALLTAPPLSTPTPLARVLERCGIVGAPDHRGETPGNGIAFCTSALDAIGERLVERDKSERFIRFEAWSCYDLGEAVRVKKAVDQLSVALAESSAREAAEAVRGFGNNVAVMNYSYRTHPQRWTISPYFDLYDLATRLVSAEALSGAVHAAAEETALAVDAIVSASVGMGEYAGFQPGRHGVYIVFPGADASIGPCPPWAHLQWYHPDDQSGFPESYGRYDWCRDGARRGNGRVENWFELMDAWNDLDDGTGGFNDYQP